jgi:methylisocitrate lyase
MPDTAAKRLRNAMAQGPVLLPGVFGPIIAKMAERIGFHACYLSGGALSAFSGVPDIGLLTLTEFVAEARRLVASTSLPVISDADTGFGEALSVERTIREFEAAGVAGIHLEDQQMPKRCGHLSGKSIVSADEMCAKIRAAVASRRDPDFLIIARTDARGVTHFDDAVERAKRYVDAGADAIFPEAMENAGEFEKFAKAMTVPLLANMTEFGKSQLLDAKTLGDMGYRLILFPLTAFRVAMKAAEATLQEVFAKGTQKGKVAEMQTRQELYDLIGYTGYEQRDQAYFGQ